MVYGPIDHFHCFSFYELFDGLPPQMPDDGWCRHSVGAICQDMRRRIKCNIDL